MEMKILETTPTGLSFADQEANKIQIIDGKKCRWIANTMPGDKWSHYDIEGDKAIRKKDGATLYVGRCMGAGQFTMVTEFERTREQNETAGMVGIYEEVECADLIAARREKG